MNKKNKKLIFGSILGALSVLAICTCLIANTNMTNQINGDDYFNLPAVTEPVAQSNNVEADSSVDADSTVDAYQSPNVRYVDQIYSSEVNQSMQRIQESYSESIKNSNDANVTDATNNQFREGFVGSSASKLSSNLLASNNNANSGIKWSVTLNKDKKFDTFTLHISTNGEHDIGSDESPAWRNGFSAKGLDGQKHNYSFFDITKVSIDAQIKPISCKAWFGCAVNNPGQESVRLSNIESINNLTSLDMTDVENASFMFMGCDLLTLNSLPNMSNLTNIEAMFALTKHFTNDIYNSAANAFTQIVNGKDAFINNATLTDINVSNWNVDACTDMSYIFCNCPNLVTINADGNTDWSKKQFNGIGMFKGCTSLKGGKDTLYSDQFTGKSYAKVDGGVSNPGYFTGLTQTFTINLTPATTSTEGTWIDSDNEPVATIEGVEYGTTVKSEYSNGVGTLTIGGSAIYHTKAAAGFICIGVSPLEDTTVTSNKTYAATFAKIWIPMQAEIHDGTKIDFYPAFSTMDQIAGYKFATYDGTNYHEIGTVNSMSDIYSALEGTRTTTLYYQKTSSNASVLSCYTVKDLSWNYVFGKSFEGPGEATEYSKDFRDNYQQDKSENNNGIKTALLTSDGFGSGWNGNAPVPKLVNGVDYSDSSINGFYKCYGGYLGGLLSYCSSAPWGCYANDSFSAQYFGVINGDWYANIRGGEGGVVLARAFN